MFNSISSKVYEERILVDTGRACSNRKSRENKYSCGKSTATAVGRVCVKT